ncbi:MAG: 50S ribosomal protein L6 [Parcubacteria group bacterium CG1_02_37_51]|uniref:Large ribosomal subunit protein uL6 n=2 Tax=Candidatus Komeiliibacteriota TaxID=1817908 RepID=A0A2M8DRJ7_9BACT|nr:MAG: 50S ribosomal protein L6 [Parcubacteria group bacterium CG1_02_37_51]PIY94816.1 MAG: 50S ribosomal protein L6 [Candidatus Komeilibacteria bacterium CG_4_10_14_0_8_um_filter_37_78]PJC01992.1 MAG: 50S ribosomal protein L6 [Candidatus Komeilibacteria bacterium CG_4_9_14_0_8_um_filter_36_9]
MSRIGKQPIIIPAGVDVKISEDLITVKGPKGSLEIAVPRLVKIEMKDQEIICSITNQENKEQKSMWGTTRSNVQNIITGATEGFSKQLEINGVGHKATMEGAKLVLNVGFSHPVEYPQTEGIELAVEKNVITVSGINRQRVGQVAAEIRAIKKPEPYKGKGIKYIDEYIRRKAGKVAKGSD